MASKIEIDNMEYSSDLLAKLGYISTGLYDDAYTNLMIHFYGLDGSTAFLEGTGKTITSSGNVQIDTDYYKFSGSSGLFDGNGYLTLSDSSDFVFGTNDFTIDCWIRWVDSDNYQHIFESRTSEGSEGFAFGIDNNDKLFFWYNGDFRIVGTTSMEAGVWHHIALVRYGNIHTIYFDGASEGTWTNNSNYTSQRCWVGRYYSTNDYQYQGHLDEYRLSAGIARWTAPFAYPTSEYGSVLGVLTESSIKTEGSYSLKSLALITESLNKTLTRTLSANYDLTGVNNLTFDIRASRIGANIKFGLHDSGGTTTEITPTIVVADTWQKVRWDLSGVSDANKDDIDSLIITIVNADAENTFYLDNFNIAQSVDIFGIIG